MTQVLRRQACLLAALLALAQTQTLAEDQGVLWPQHPVRIDRSRQTYERLPALQAQEDKRIWISVPQRLTILDGARFSFDGKTYRIAKVHPISAKRICHDADGTRWGCGRTAVVLLNNLVRGKRLLCDIRQGEKEILLDRCESGTREIAAEIIGHGLGRAQGDGPLMTVEQLARKKHAGLWRNPDCALDFDHC